MRSDRACLSSLPGPRHFPDREPVPDHASHYTPPNRGRKAQGSCQSEGCACVAARLGTRGGGPRMRTERSRRGGTPSCSGVLGRQLYAGLSLRARDYKSSFPQVLALAAKAQTSVEVERGSHLRGSGKGADLSPHRAEQLGPTLSR